MKSRLGRILFLLASFIVLATIAPSPPRRPPPGPGEALLIAVPIPFDADDADHKQAGALIFRRGWQLTSPDPRFGGLSAMQVGDGKVTALSDSGTIMTFDLPRSGGPGGRVRFTPLPGPGPATRKSNRDTESLFIRGGQAWVGFERHNMIWRYRRSDWRAEAAARPRSMREWGGNSGAESLVGIGDDLFLAIAEGREGEDYSELILFRGDPAELGTRAERFRYRRIPDFRPTDAALLPSGRLLVLNRRISLFGGMAAKLVLVDLNGLRPNMVVAGREIAQLRSPLQVDNMEALSVTLEDHKIIVRIASDDNFLPLQRTLLLEFELDERLL